MTSPRLLIAVGCVAALAAGCASQAPPPPAPVAVSQSLMQSTPPPASSTPVPVVHARHVPGAGRSDPFVALFGPSENVPPPKPAKSVSVSAFPNIPTLPGFSNGPGGTVRSIWDGVALTGVVRDSGFTAIVQVDTNSYIVRSGDVVGGKFRVAAIGPDFISLETTGSPVLERTFRLGG